MLGAFPPPKREPFRQFTWNLMQKGGGSWFVPRFFPKTTNKGQVARSWPFRFPLIPDFGSGFPSLRCPLVIGEKRASSFGWLSLKESEPFPKKAEKGQNPMGNRETRLFKCSSRKSSASMVRCSVSGNPRFSQGLPELSPRPLLQALQPLRRLQRYQSLPELVAVQAALPERHVAPPPLVFCVFLGGLFAGNEEETHYFFLK